MLDAHERVAGLSEEEKAMRVVISRPPFLYESDLPWWRALLCRLGFHAFRYFVISPKLQREWSEDINRRCKHCRLMEYTDDGETWKPRL